MTNQQELYYGLTSRSQIFNSVHKVCGVLGRGRNGAAPDMCLETIAAETQMGTYPDTTKNSGHGLTQFDQIGFIDVVQRTRAGDKQKIKDKFGYDLDTVLIEDLDTDPVLAIIFMRLKYKLRPEEIPADIVSRAIYWKRFYNSSEGKGTTDHYLESAERHLYPALP